MTDRLKLLMQLDAEAASGGFLWERKPVSPYEPPPPKKNKKREPTEAMREQWRREKRARREKWIAMGIIKPRAA